MGTSDVIGREILQSLGMAKDRLVRIVTPRQADGHPGYTVKILNGPMRGSLSWMSEEAVNEALRDKQNVGIKDDFKTLREFALRNQHRDDNFARAVANLLALYDQQAIKLASTAEDPEPLAKEEPSSWTVADLALNRLRRYATGQDDPPGWEGLKDDVAWLLKMYEDHSQQVSDLTKALHQQNLTSYEATENEVTQAKQKTVTSSQPVIVASQAPDRLEGLLAMQSQFMQLVGIPFLLEHEEFLTHPVFQAAVDGVVTEAAEVLGAMSVLTKPWKQRSTEETREHVLEELTDVLFMLLECYILTGKSASDIVKLYQHKLVGNLGRLGRAQNSSDPRVADWQAEIIGIRPPSGDFPPRLETK